MEANRKDFEVTVNEMPQIEDQFQSPKYTGLAKFRYQYRIYFAEFVGTTLLLLFGDGVVAQVTFNKAAKGSSYLSINLGWAFGLMCAILVSAPVSGAHLNPAVTIANAVFRKFPWRQVPGYIASQMLGGFTGAALVYIMYWPAFDDYDGGVRQTVGLTSTAGIFSTYPYPSSPLFSSLVTEIINTAVMMVCILGINDPRHKIPSYAGALMVGLLIGAIGLSIGMMTGYAMNPARDLGPRIFTAVAGWGWEPFTAANYYFWIPIVGPIIGALVGVLFYDSLIFSE